MTITKQMNKEVLLQMYETLGMLKNLKSQTAKPEIARVYAVTITEMEKTLAYFKAWVVDSVYFPSEKE